MTNTKCNLEVGASLNALASGFSELSNLELLQTSTEGKIAISKLAEGIRLLADIIIAYLKRGGHSLSPP